MNASYLIYQALSPLVAEQVYPLVVPEWANKTTPYIIYTPISSVPISTLDGITHHERTRIQVDIYHHDYDSLLELVSLVLDSLDSLPMSEIESSSYQVDGGLYRASCDVIFNATTKLNKST